MAENLSNFVEKSSYSYSYNSQNSEQMWKEKYARDERLKQQTILDYWIFDFIKEQNGNIYDFYEFGKKIGKGKFGIVYSAIHKLTGQERAIKIIKMKNVQTTPDH